MEFSGGNTVGYIKTLQHGRPSVYFGAAYIDVLLGCDAARARPACAILGFELCVLSLLLVAKTGWFLREPLVQDILGGREKKTLEHLGGIRVKELGSVVYTVLYMTP